MIRRLSAVPLFLALGVLAVLVGSAGGEPPPAKLASPAAADAGDARPAAVAERRGRRRPGCGRFCRQAGSFGGDGGPRRQAVKVPAQRIRVARDEIFGVWATCRLDRRCVGAILIDSPNPCCEPDNIAHGVSRYGRADLRIAAHSTRKVLVGITRNGLRYLRRHRRDPDAYAAVDLRHDGDDVVYLSGRLTLLAPPAAAR